MFSFKETLLKKIEQSSLSMRAISLNAGLSESAVKKIIAADNASPRVETVGKLALGIGCSPFDLLPPEWKRSAGSVDVSLLQKAVANAFKLRAEVLKTDGVLSEEQFALLAAKEYERLQKVESSAEILKLINQKKDN